MSIYSDFYFKNYQGENMDQVLNPAFSGAQTKQGRLRKPIGLNDHNTLKSADHYGDQEKMGDKDRGGSTNYPDREREKQVYLQRVNQRANRVCSKPRSSRPP